MYKDYKIVNVPHLFSLFSKPIPLSACMEEEEYVVQRRVPFSQKKEGKAFSICPPQVDSGGSGEGGSEKRKPGVPELPSWQALQRLLRQRWKWRCLFPLSILASGRWHKRAITSAKVTAHVAGCRRVGVGWHKCLVWCGVVWYGVEWCGEVWWGVVRCGVSGVDLEEPIGLSMPSDNDETSSRI